MKKKWHMCVRHFFLSSSFFSCVLAAVVCFLLCKRDHSYAKCCSLSSVNVQYVHKNHLLSNKRKKNVMNSRAYKPYVWVCVSPCALLMHFCNEIYRFIVVTSHDFLECMRALLSAETTFSRGEIKLNKNSIESNGHTRKFIRNVYVWFPLCVIAVRLLHIMCSNS